jgi:hypothetical protein
MKLIIISIRREVQSSFVSISLIHHKLKVSLLLYILPAGGNLQIIIHSKVLHKYISISDMLWLTAVLFIREYTGESCLGKIKQCPLPNAHFILTLDSKET